MLLQVKYWVEKGKQGHLVYKYLLRRRPDQGDLATSRVEFGGKSAPKGLSALTRPGVYDVDLSCGKEAKPVCLLLPIHLLCSVQGDSASSSCHPWGLMPPGPIAAVTRQGM